jgi:membrane fusion protein (multidrug efflux system)
MKRKILIAIVVGVLLAGGVWSMHVFSSNKKENAPQETQKKPPEVLVASATRAAISRTLELTGELAATEAVVIAAVAEGTIVFCPWREGDRVKAGQKIVEIHRPVYRSDVQAAEAAVRVAQAKLDDTKAGTRSEEIAKAEESVRQFEESAAFAKADFERTAKLVESGALPGEILEKARVENIAQATRLAAAREHLEMLKVGPTKTALAVQQASLDEAKARLAVAKARLDECVINAPFSGTVTKAHVRPGDLATAKAPLIELANLSTVVVRFAVPEAVAPTVHPGMALGVKLDMYPGKLFTGKVIRVYPDLDQRMRTRTAEAKIAGTPNVMPGMFARLKLILETVDDAVVVPVEAVVVTPKGDRVAFVIEAGKAVQRKVATGIEEGGKIQILGGIEPGEQVVIAGNEKLKDGAPVRLAGGGKPKVSAPGTEMAPGQADSQPRDKGAAK